MDALHAWLDEGRRLLDAQRDDVPESVLTAIGAAIDRSREAMAAQQDGRPKRRISRAATQTGATLASAFLDPKSLSALAACSRAMKKIARAEALWNAHTAREYPEAATLRTLGGVDALVGQREYARMRRLSNPHLDLFLQPPLGIDGYVALVVMKYGDDIIIPGRLFEITLGADLRVDSFLIDVGAFSPQADGSFLLDGHNVILDDGFKSNEVSVSVSWRQGLRSFEITPNSVEVLATPRDFYESLLTACRGARSRISLSALYWGTGALEQDLAAAVEGAMAARDAKVTVVLDAARARRADGAGRTRP
ncbi:hypothetical protein SO694_00006325 [Aureococcus anophagefferens]|uniref:CDP-diacylglycerol--glycerol-3-phosphate 3-phosphatidyltransferase n=1 Tax=Aureococcus anophagefferens TaxID=44056 RepID=A0ABR1GAE9_AURAN